ncbi:MAG: type II toxin-antitoxin system HigB family toxin [Fimbriimonadales bacterium]
MRVLSRKPLAEFWLRHPSAEIPLRAWYRESVRAAWKSFADLREDFPSADLVGKCVVFNISGNSYRLICRVNFESMHVLVRWVGNHAEYDKIKVQDICEP